MAHRPREIVWESRHRGLLIDQVIAGTHQKTKAVEHWQVSSRAAGALVLAPEVQIEFGLTRRMMDSFARAHTSGPPVADEVRFRLMDAEAYLDVKCRASNHRPTWRLQFAERSRICIAHLDRHIGVPSSALIYYDGSQWSLPVSFAENFNFTLTGGHLVSI